MSPDSRTDKKGKRVLPAFGKNANITEKDEMKSGDFS